MTDNASPNHGLSKIVMHAQSHKLSMVHDSNY